MTQRPEQNLDIIKRALGADYLEHRILGLVLEEDFETGQSTVRVDLSDPDGNNRYTVEGTGVGLVDALTHALLSRFAPEYRSLETIEFTGFDVQAKFDTKNERSGADAIGVVSLEVRNSEGQVFTFADSSRSIASSAARAVLAAVEYFVNSERAYVSLYRALRDAKERDRPDLVARYTRELAEVVKSTSYTEVIERIKSELD
ncbi:MAG: hypothetical protein D6689_13635 [Deltaproteobacteria bacterium]|nr:MAG: hypothetical protein D6689_13635 [Deltaproteobacteria bacterium]